METLFEEKRRWHEAQAQLPIREKFRILIEMQRAHLPLIARLRPLKPWERPWEPSRRAWAAPSGVIRAAGARDEPIGFEGLGLPSRRPT
jgi:hypothetical protein